MYVASEQEGVQRWIHGVCCQAGCVERARIDRCSCWLHAFDCCRLPLLLLTGGKLVTLFSAPDYPQVRRCTCSMVAAVR
jgi:hypothetical protein